MHSLHLSPSSASTGQMHSFGRMPHLKNDSSATVLHECEQRQSARMSCTVSGFSLLESVNSPVHEAHCAPCLIQAEHPQTASVEFRHVDNSSLIAAHEQLHGAVVSF